ncbi:MAG TPA: hypothetical protein DIS62_02180 [Candidatus Kerfeldbacteria bacterium]|nr:hypothetical protein [Candidatus Kerfeldbacteria bacterium]
MYIIHSPLTAYGHRLRRDPAKCGDGVPLKAGSATSPQYLFVKIQLSNYYAVVPGVPVPLRPTSPY